VEEYTAGFARKEEAPKRFKSFDKNADGKLSYEEFVTPARLK
jgi:Ca2+-binding EF-hand superfamily protein